MPEVRCAEPAWHRVPGRQAEEGRQALMAHRPERSDARRRTTSEDVFKGQRSTSHLSQAKAGRHWKVSERGPFEARPKRR